MRVRVRVREFTHTQTQKEAGKVGTFLPSFPCRSFRWGLMFDFSCQTSHSNNVRANSGNIVADPLTYHHRRVGPALGLQRPLLLNY